VIPVSVVIIAHNEEQNIVSCIEAVKVFSNDILVVENGSTDQTAKLATDAGARVLQTEWKGYSETKNYGNRYAKNDWILSLDADEIVQPSLVKSIQQVFSGHLPEETMVFRIRRCMWYAGRRLYFGSVLRESRDRLFHRATAMWNGAAVHEELFFSRPVQKSTLKGYVVHRSYRSENEHRERLEKYARLSARQMKERGRSYSVWKYYLSPAFYFVRNFIFRLGFLDGQAGYRFARNEMRYVKNKYRYLKELK